MKSVIQMAISIAAVVVMTAATLEAVGEQPSPAKREIIPGSELMSPQERERYRQRIRAAKTPEDQQKVRNEHVKQMRERARLRGLRFAEPAEGKRGK